MELFEVGGCVRDEILGIKSKDIDFTVVLDRSETVMPVNGIELSPFLVMRDKLLAMGFEIFLESPEYFTIRARFPDKVLPQRPGVFPGTADLVKRTQKGLTADFVLARKEGSYSDGRRPDAVQVGTLQDDLARRDFTMNAIAKDAKGNLIDPFNGQRDIADKVIRAVGNARERIIEEDALRGLRAIRFSVQKGFAVDQEVVDVLRSDEFKAALRSVSTERQREELEKMFKVHTPMTLVIFHELGLVDTLFNNTGLRLMPTMKG